MFIVVISNTVLAMNPDEQEAGQRLFIPKSILLTAYNASGKELEWEGQKYRIIPDVILTGEVGDQFLKTDKEAKIEFRNIDGAWGYYFGGMETEQVMNECGIVHTRFVEKPMKGCVLISLEEAP